MTDLVMVFARIAAFMFGAYLVVFTFVSAIRAFVLPRSDNVLVTRVVFLLTRQAFNLRVRRAQTYAQRDRIMALYAPISLLMLPIAWLSLTLIGFMLMFWSVEQRSLHDAFRMSGSSLLTLGFSYTDTAPSLTLSFIEGALGLILVALLIGFLPTMYSTFSQREAVVTMLEVRAGSPPSVSQMLTRIHGIHGMDKLHETWVAWEQWFTFVSESHTSLPALVFFRSPQSENSWLTASGVILDTASFVVSAVDIPDDPQARLTIRAGFICLRQICDFFRISYNPDPRPDDPISITRDEFVQVYDALKAEGLPMKADVEQAWRDYAGWRVNYDAPLLALARLTMAPYAPWVSDRSLPRIVTQPRKMGIFPVKQAAP